MPRLHVLSDLTALRNYFSVHSRLQPKLLMNGEPSIIYIRFAEKLANGQAKAFGLMKKITDQSSTAGLAEILEQERITQAMMITTDDHLEGVSAFKEKRKPVSIKNSRFYEWKE